MKILHTSDWHLGQNFFTKSRKKEHQAFLDWLLNEIDSNQIDAVIVAGDIFDTGAPPSYARELYNQFVVSISQRNCSLVVLGGNHDSVSTLKESKSLLACLHTYVVANTSDDIEDQLLVLNNRNGEVGAIVCAVPFVRPRDVLTSQAGESGTEKRQALGDAIKAHYHQLYQAAVELRQENSWQVPIIATGHLTALGVSPSKSVRDIYIGTLDGFAAEAFPPADYIALGHIHRPQIVAKSEHIRYSGSPIPLSFDELKFNKQVVLVEFDGEQRVRIEPISIPSFQPMGVLKGSLEEIDVQLSQYKDHDDPNAVWLHIEVSVQDYLSDLQQCIQVMTEGLNVEVLQLQRSRGPKAQALSQEAKETLSELTPNDVFQKRLALEVFEGEAELARRERIQTQFSQIVEDVEHVEASE
ncbi:exonuclease subunit SbcD [Enterovibrio nigricans]|uniref:Nuclease SbcCD subunit D n=1 Tax=Enterovibrio nigricans DSM 22720 TaxID=1121868 RepID=A0A1T4V064_9GAMM|nr:exonuclease subunit SbcD [Enterovibrio nigricans]SKA58360.1 Exodeoxyribonuclease I subunit D [Enterovibrio nigricans DSM 22720]